MISSIACSSGRSWKLTTPARQSEAAPAAARGVQGIVVVGDLHAGREPQRALRMAHVELPGVAAQLHLLAAQPADLDIAVGQQQARCAGFHQARLVAAAWIAASPATSSISGRPSRVATFRLVCVFSASVSCCESSA